MSPFLLLLCQEPTVPATPPALDFRQAPVVAELERIRLTPKLDGHLDEEEWDAFGQSGDTKTFLQWEPGVLHVAASALTGKDLIVSIDPKSDGWLVGRDNVEIRIGVREGKPTIRLRFLDATNVAGPTYREIAGLTAASQVVVGPDSTVEASIVDPGLGFLPTKGGKLAARVDVVASEAPDAAANEPRTLASLNLREFRAAALPAGLNATAETGERVIPGDNLSIRFGFSGEPMPKRIALRSEGLARESTSATELPFPTSNKKTVSLDYQTRIQREASIGYRIARATLTGADGIPGIVQASYRIAPLLDLDLTDTQVRPADKDRSLKVGFVARGNSRRGLSAATTISVPAPYRIVNGDDTQRLLLAEPKLPLKKSFGLFVPANASGAVPITFSMTVNGKKLDVVRYLVID